MIIFNEPNTNDGKWKCPICGTCDIKPVVLVPIMGTEDGYNMRANQYHVECIELYESSTPARNTVVIFSPSFERKDV